MNENNTIETNEIISNTDYYPFGLTHSGELQTSIANNYKYKFQGKELQEENSFNQYDFGSRMYDASLGRWFAIDPQGQFSSPYLAMGNNPVMMVDPDGEFSFLAILIGAFVYTAYDAAQGNINNWGDFF
ncbi:MAG: RHS repeat domain-containing protein [Tenacibaculum sp.]